MNLMMIIMMIYFLSIFLIKVTYNHILMTLMSLEILMLTLMLILYNMLLNINIEYFIMFFLMIIVCEGILGLTLLILLIQFKGMDKLNSMNLILW